MTQSGAKPLFWQNLERQDCFHLTLLRHQNIKTSLYTISKNSWVLPFLVNLTPVTMKLQLTVFLDHPVYGTGGLVVRGDYRYVRFGLVHIEKTTYYVHCVLGHGMYNSCPNHCRPLDTSKVYASQLYVSLLLKTKLCVSVHESVFELLYGNC